jgi:hypothetical protein
MSFKNPSLTSVSMFHFLSVVKLVKKHRMFSNNGFLDLQALGSKRTPLQYIGVNLMNSDVSFCSSSNLSDNIKH